MAYNSSNRFKTIVERLKRLSGGAESITIGTLQKKWFDLSYSATKKRLEGVPHQKGGLYNIEDVAAKLVQTEIYD